MVYCGKPSKGCQTCRERKIRCDQLPEGCGQCAKQKIECPGYRDQLDLLFRNESQNVVRKAKAREAKSKHGSSAKGSRASTPSTYSAAMSDLSKSSDLSKNLSLATRQDRQLPDFITSAVIAVPARTTTLSYINLAPTLDERATSFFVSNYVIGVQGPTRGHLDVINSTYHFDDNLMASIKAVGLAGFANIENSSEAMKEARKQYSAALRLTNSALRSPTSAKKDSTLLSIMILGIYETVTGNNQKSLQSWVEHIRGATALVKLRGPEQLNTPEGRRMVIQVMSNLLIACIQREHPLPEHILQLRQNIRSYVDLDDPAWQVQEMMVQFVTFRAAIKDVSSIDPRWILASALAIDGAFLTLFSNPPLLWKYETRYTDSDPDNVWKGCYHVYYDYWVAQIWNAMRTCRIMLNEAIRDVLLRGFSTVPPVFSAMEHSAQFQLSTDTLFHLQSDILASVPQHIGFTPNQPTPGSGALPLSFPPQTLSFNNADVPPIFKAMTKNGLSLPSERSLPALRASGGYFLLWPLFLAAVVDVASEESRQWVVGRLRNIARTMGIRQAFVLATVVEKKLPIRVWMTDQKEAKDVRQGPYMEDPEEVELSDDEFD